MKDYSFRFCLAVIGTLAAWIMPANAQMEVRDDSLIMATNSNAAELRAILMEQLAEAQRQTELIEIQLEAVGLPGEVEMQGDEAALEDIVRATDEGLLSNDELSEMTAAVTGEEVFTEDVDGLFEPIGAVATNEEGEAVGDRDPELYKYEGALLARIREYQRIRQVASERKMALQEAMIAALDAIRDADDLATVQKHAAVIEVLKGQIASTEQEITIASNDVEMLEKEIRNQAYVDSRGRSEARHLERLAKFEEAVEAAEGMAGEEGGEAFGQTGRLPFPGDEP